MIWICTLHVVYATNVMHKIYAIKYTGRVNLLVFIWLYQNHQQIHINLPEFFRVLPHNDIFSMLNRFIGYIISTFQWGSQLTAWAIEETVNNYRNDIDDTHTRTRTRIRTRTRAHLAHTHAHAHTHTYIYYVCASEWQEALSGCLWIFGYLYINAHCYIAYLYPIGHWFTFVYSL